MPIPESLLVDLQSVPRDRPVALLMRHSNRYPITDPARNYEVGLTDEGFRLAAQLGSRLGSSFTPGKIFSSPVGRCVDTAGAIARGAGWGIETRPHPLLSHDHISPVWARLAAGQACESVPAEVAATLAFLLEFPDDAPLLHIHVTHDTILCSLVSCLLDAPFEDEHWPDFLEGAFFWLDEGAAWALWRGQARILALPAGVA